MNIVTLELSYELYYRFVSALDHARKLKSNSYAICKFSNPVHLQSTTTQYLNMKGVMTRLESLGLLSCNTKNILSIQNFHIDNCLLPWCLLVFHFYDKDKF